MACLNASDLGHGRFEDDEVIKHALLRAPSGVGILIPLNYKQ